MTRSDLADTLAIERVEYEKMVAANWDPESGAEYGQTKPEDAHNPLLDFVRSEAIGHAKAGRVVGAAIATVDGRKVFCGGIDFEKLTKVVEARLPRWRETVARVDAERSAEPTPV